MLDPITLDQLRTLITVAEQGSFSAAGRKLRRVQSAVSTAMANLEAQLGLTIWDRTTRVPKLTAQGKVVVASARRVLSEVESLRAVTSELRRGVEPVVSLCVDVLFPLPPLVQLCGAFAAQFPGVELRIDTQLMSAVSARVLSGAATIGVASPLGLMPELERKLLAKIRMVPVVAPNHPLAAVRGPIAQERFSELVQIVLAERSDEGVADQAVLSPRTWRVADLHAKGAMIEAGLGWGNLPEHFIREKLKRRQLIAIEPAAWSADEHTLALSAVYRARASFGPAHRWLLTEMEMLCARELGAAASKRKPR